MVNLGMLSLNSKKGTVLVLASFLVLITVSSLIGIERIYRGVCEIISYQNRADAHMLSVIGLYVETLDTVSWINKQLQHIAVLSALISFVPQLAPLMATVQKLVDGLQAYQDFLLLRLKVYGPVLDNELRYQNDLFMPGNYHSFLYRRQPSIDLVFITIPGLIEINSDIFDTACVKHRGIITHTKACIDNELHKKDKGWFAPTEEKWGVLITNAY
ncbi:MAG: hypothetical protein WCQ53_03120 [bacterium]